jgi:hypothetical protein
LGGVVIRGVITEVGQERSESVGLIGSLLVRRLLGGDQRMYRTEELQIPLAPFTMSADDGTLYDCTIRGELRGGFLKLGEPVEVRGRLSRARVIRVKTVQSLRTGARSKGHVRVPVRLASFLAGTAYFVMAVVALLLASLLFMLWQRS